MSVLQRGILCVALVAASLPFALKLRLVRDPQTAASVFSITIRKQDEAPLFIEREITIPVEDALAGTRGLKKIFSRSARGESVVVLELHPETDMDQAYLEIREILDRMFLRADPGVSRPELSRGDQNDREVFSAVFAPGSDEEELRSAFSALEGAGSVRCGGGSVTELLVNSEDDLRGARTAAQTLRQNLQAGVWTSNEEWPLVLQQYAAPLHEMSRWTLPQGQSLRSLVRLSLKSAEPERGALANGQRVCILQLGAAGNADLLRLCAQARELCVRLGGTVMQDEGKELSQSILRGCLISASLLSALWTIGMLLAWLTSRDRCASLLRAGLLSILSLLTALAGLAAFEIHLSPSSLCALSFGLLTAFLCFHILRRPLLLILLAAGLLPLAFAPSDSIRQSLPFLVSLGCVLVPALFWYLLFLDPRGTPPLLPVSENRPKPRLALVLTPLFCCFLALSVFICLGHQPAPWLSRSLHLTIDYPAAYHSAAVQTLSAPLAKRLLASEGLVRSWYCFEPERAQWWLEFEDDEASAALLKRLPEYQTAAQPGFLSNSGGPPGRSELQFSILADDFRVLRRCSDLLGQSLSHPGLLLIRHFKEPSEEVQILPDRTALAQSGLSQPDFFAALNSHIGKPVVAKTIVGTRQIDVRMDARRLSPAELGSLRLDQGGTRADSLAALERRFGSGTISRQERRRALSFSVQAAPEYMGRVRERLEALEEEMILPAGASLLTEKSDERTQTALMLLAAGAILILAAGGVLAGVASGMLSHAMLVGLGFVSASLVLFLCPATVLDGLVFPLLLAWSLGGSAWLFRSMAGSFAALAAFVPLLILQSPLLAAWGICGLACLAPVVLALAASRILARIARKISSP